MKAMALRTNRCEKYILGLSYEVLKLTRHAMRIATPSNERKSRMVERKDFHITPEPWDSEELINKL